MNKAEHKMMPHIMVKTMRLHQKIMLAKKMWQDETASKDNSSSHDGAASHKEAASQDKALSSKQGGCLQDKACKAEVTSLVF